MILVFISRTKNIKKIVEKLGFLSENLFDISENPKAVIRKDFCLLTYTDLLGSIPSVVEDFLKVNSGFLKAVAGSGNRNFGENFCGAAKKISKQYGVPLLMEFELSGCEKTISIFKEKLCRIG